MLSKNILFFLMFITCSSLGLSQNVPKRKVTRQHVRLPELSKEEMQEDYQYLHKTLKDVYPFYDLFFDISGIEGKRFLQHNMVALDSCKSTEEFIWQVFKSINTYPDKHLEILHPKMLGYYKKNEKRFALSIDEESIQYQKQYNALLQDSIYAKVRLGLRFKYIDGRYFSLRAFSYNKVLYGKGVELMAIDSMPVVDFVQKHRFTIPNLSWDQEQKQYFSENLLLTPVLSRLSSVGLSFKMPDKRIHHDVFKLRNTVEILTKKPEIKDEIQVRLIQDSVLYIRMPYMFNEQLYLEKIRHYKPVSDHIKKVLIDVRNNRGGRDQVWKSLIGAIVDKPISSAVQLNAPANSSIINSYVYQMGIDTTKLLKKPIVGKTYIPLTTKKEVVKVDSLSLNYRGKLFVLVDENSFSAANSLLSLSKESERIVSIGYRSNRIGGRGLSPLLIQLPNSKLFVRIPFTIDFTRVKSKQDLLHNIPEIELKYTIEDFIESYYSTDSFSVNYLIEEDLLFKGVMQLQ